MSPKNDTCPVCRMLISDDIYIVENYHGIYYYSCSEQCGSNFILHPQLYVAKKPQNVLQRIKKRKLVLSNSTSEEQISVFTEEIEQVMGLESIRVENHNLFITYDLVQLSMNQIEQLLSDLEIELDQYWLNNMKRRWILNSEKNELDNLAAPAGACCNKPPVK